MERNREYYGKKKGDPLDTCEKRRRRKENGTGYRRL